MEEITKMISMIIRETEGSINRALDNVYISTTIKVFIGLYAAFAAPKLPGNQQKDFLKKKNYGRVPKYM